MRHTEQEPKQSPGSKYLASHERIALAGNEPVRLMIRHLLRVASICAVGVACMFYPFMPGSHHRLAVTLSGIAQVLGLAGLLLVPVGLLWLIHDRANSGLPLGTIPRGGKSDGFGFCALGVSLRGGAGVALTLTGAADRRC